MIWLLVTTIFTHFSHQFFVQATPASYLRLDGRRPFVQSSKSVPPLGSRRLPPIASRLVAPRLKANDHPKDHAANSPTTQFTNSSLHKRSSFLHGNVGTLCKSLALPSVTMALALVVTSGLASPALASTGAATSESIGSSLLSFILHLDKHLAGIIAQHGSWTYALLFAIVFAETGLVVTPFLPGDSLLFACGAFCALQALNLATVITTLFTAAVLGDAVNYALGSYFGREAFTKFPGIFKPEYLKKTEAFFAKYGGKTVVLARFIPILRTFAPFVAGVGSMTYRSFAFFNVAGAALWTVSFSVLGYLFGGLPFVKKNFTLVVLGIVAVSVLPVIWEIITAKKEPPLDPNSATPRRLLLRRG
eukprot:gnl/MRDRNA2_/MRDRNA2_18708_c0_seq1.p1 gnl/MRDRNA2_/MRDRNA2_18708_c0~~gnl/MRDRNA2_/MRDRNA2_18708_c0_seq1.p1  ORF type:complete len:362 (-),score=46.53 gnl/MRDRNA2_/MRDRNA2_18708_c0_seq1:114-1199(-)